MQQQPHNKNHSASPLLPTSTIELLPGSDKTVVHYGSFNTNCIIFRNVEISKKGTKNLLRKIKNSSVWHGIFKFFKKRRKDSTLKCWTCHGVSSTSNLVVIVVVGQVKDFFPEFFFTGSVQREETLHGIKEIGMQFWAWTDNQSKDDNWIASCTLSVAFLLF